MNTQSTKIKKMKKLQKSNQFAYLMLAISAILYIFGIQAIMQTAHVLSSELDAIPLVITLLIPKMSPYFGIMLLGVNIPLLLYFFFKIRRRFVIRTMFFLLCSTSFSGLFFIPGVEHWFHSLIIPGSNTEEVTKKVLNDIWPMFVLPAVGGALVGTAVAISWKYGGSTGGADIIVYYFSTKKKVNVSTLLFIVSLILVTTSFVTLVVLQEDVREHWLPSITGSLIYIAVLSTAVEFIFPKYSKVQIEIHSQHIEKLTTWLKANHSHPFRIETAQSGYTGKDVHFIMTVVLILEVKEFVNSIKDIDPASWVSAIHVSNVFGRFNTRKVDGV